MSVNVPRPGHFPLTPGRPLVYRCRSRARWGFLSNCLRFSTERATSSEQPNCDDWADALRAARQHVHFWHKSPAQLETEALERAFAEPAWVGGSA